MSTGRTKKEEAPEQQGGDSTLTIMIAFFANGAVAIAKSVVAVITGSASMLAEAAHSWADTGNQVLLLIADRRSRKPPDDSHPLGYGRDSYVWSMFAAMGLFVAGGAVSVWHGISELSADEPSESYTVAYIVLGVAFLFEGVSFVQAYRQISREAEEYERDVLEHALETSDPTLRAVFAEDAVALTGLVIAAVGLYLHQVTGEAIYDAAGSILIGVLLIAVAIVLIQRNRRFLTGQETDARLRQAALERIRKLPNVARVVYLRLEYVGPRQVLLTASVDLVGEEGETTVAYRLRELERELEADPHVTEALLTLATPDQPSL